MGISLETTVGELASAIPHATRVFEKHRIDYCCGGRRPLAEACERVGADVQAVVAALEEPVRVVDVPVDWREAPLPDLVKHILDVHHVYTWEELPRIEALMTKVARVHGDRHPELVQMKPIVLGLVDELRTHLLKEERILFPYILELASAGEAPAPHFGTVANPIRMMDSEHEDAGEAFGTIRRLSDDLAPPSDACGSYRALFAAITELEADLHLHIHLESNILFPRSIALEAKRNGSA